MSTGNASMICRSRIFILNNQYMGMVRQWQEILHGGRLTPIPTPEALPDFVKMAEAFGCVGPARAKARGAGRQDPGNACGEKTGLFDVRVDPAENCYPMIPSGAAHNEMLLFPDDGGEITRRRNDAWFKANDARYPRSSSPIRSSATPSRCWSINEAGVLARVVGLFLRSRLTISKA